LHWKITTKVVAKTLCIGNSNGTATNTDNKQPTVDTTFEGSIPDEQPESRTTSTTQTPTAHCQSNTTVKILCRKHGSSSTLCKTVTVSAVRCHLTANATTVGEGEALRSGGNLGGSTFGEKLLFGTTTPSLLTPSRPELLPHQSSTVGGPNAHSSTEFGLPNLLLPNQQ